MNIFKNLEKDPIPNYLYLTHISKEEITYKQKTNLKNHVLSSQKVLEVTDLQWKDGSWGRFHSMDTSSKSNYTTEKAIRRLLNLGLDKDDLPVKFAVSYMESYIDGTIDYRDYKEKKHDWDLVTNLFTATWLLRIDEDNEKGKVIASKWAAVVSAAFANGEYDEVRYRKAYDKILKPESGKEYWKIDNFYIVSILKGMLEISTERAFLRHIMNNDRGIYYIYDKKLSEFPNITEGKNIVRYLTAIDMIASYKTGHEFLNTIIENIEILADKDGLWDFGKSSKDNIVLPMSDNWRTDSKRKIDCSIHVALLINKYHKYTK